ncbi:hypothetical protein D3C85_1405520 [compost metagenome]
MVKPKRKPEQAACKSYPHALVAPTLSASTFAVAGKVKSGVVVQKMIRSISLASIPLFFKRPLTAGTAKSEVPKPSPFNILRSLIPVLLVIHSSEVSTSVSNSSLVKT